MGVSETILILLVALVAIAFSALMIYGIVLIVRPLFRHRGREDQAQAGYSRDLGPKT